MNLVNTKNLNNLLFFLILVVTFIGVGINIYEQQQVDRSKLSEQVELSKGFQRWITNLKNKGLELEADEFTLYEENEVFNTKWMKVKSVDEEGVMDEYERILKENEGVVNVEFSPSERIFIDYRMQPRNGYDVGEVRYYGQRDNKIIDLRALGCVNQQNCYFDRGYFLENDIFVVSEFSLFENKDEEIENDCNIDELCTYTVKIHVVDLKDNQRLIYEDEPFELNLQEFIPNF